MSMVMSATGPFWWATTQKWVDYKCNEPLPFVCQNLNTWVPAPNYTVFKQPKLKWAQASAYCTSLGGSLASITSEYHNAVIIKAMQQASLNDGWIGGNDIASEGTWRWSKDDKSFCSSYCGMTPSMCGSNYDCSWTNTWACQFRKKRGIGSNWNSPVWKVTRLAREEGGEKKRRCWKRWLL